MKRLIAGLLLLLVLPHRVMPQTTGVRIIDGNNNELNCTKQANITLTASGDTQIIAAPADGTSFIKICHISWSTTAAEDFKVDQGTGSNCGSSTVSITGLYKSVQSLLSNFTPQSALRTTVGGSAVCLNQSANQTVGGLVIYAVTSAN